MHLGKPLLRRTVTPRPEKLPDPVPVDEPVTTVSEDATGPAVSEPEPVR